MSKKVNISSFPQINSSTKKETIINLKNLNNDNNEDNKKEEEEEKEEKEEEEEKEEKEENEEENEDEENEIEERKEEEEIEEKKENETNKQKKMNIIEEEKNSSTKKAEIFINLVKDNNNNKNNNKSNKNNSKNNNKIINIENNNYAKKDLNYKLKAEILEKENIEIKNNLNKKQEEIQKLSKINYKLRKNLEKVSSKVDTLLKKANENFEKLKINKAADRLNQNKQNDLNNASANEKDSLSKEKQLKTSLSLIHYLTKDNKKLKEEIENLNRLSGVDTHSLELLKKKEDEIMGLNDEIRKLKDEMNQLKYAEKTIEDLKKKIILLNDKINKLNKKCAELKEENENIKLNNNSNYGNNSNNTNAGNNKVLSIINKSHNKKVNKILNSRNFSNKKNILLRQRSSSLNNLRKKNIMKFCSTGKNFYKLFNESEQKAISTLFESEEDLKSFKQKIEILEKRNFSAEKQFEKEIKDLKKLVHDKEEEIKTINNKMRESELKIKGLESKSKEKENEKEKDKSKSKEKQKIKKLNVKQQLKEYGYDKNNNTKDDQIEKLNKIINKLRDEINKNHIAKQKEKEMDEISKELGIEGVIDVKKIISSRQKLFEEQGLKIIKKVAEVFIKGKININNINNNVKDANTIRILKNVNGIRDNTKKRYTNYNTYKKSSKSLNFNRMNSFKGNNNNIVSFSLQKGKKK